MELDHDRRMIPQLSLALVNFAADDPGDWRFLLDRARAADEAGIDRVVVSDHVVFGEHLEAYAEPALGGIAGGRQPTGPDGQWLEPMTLLSVIAGVTSRVRLSTGILLAALRRPVVLAKVAATLDVLSSGRLDLGVGVGWQREEYEAAGLDFDDRGRLLDHALEVCRVLWLEQRARYESDELSFEAIHMSPKPVAAGGVPIWVSGTLNASVISRLARFGAGWIPWGAHLGDLTGSIARMRDGVAALGRDPLEIGVVGSVVAASGDRPVDAERIMEPVAAMVAAGVTDVRLFLPFPPDADELTDVLRRLVAAFDATTGRPARS
jgi:probable F420-dependent oxidoreductase